MVVSLRFPFFLIGYMEQVFRKSFEKISIDRENQFKSTRNFRSNGVMEVYDHAHSANKLKTRAEVSF